MALHTQTETPSLQTIALTVGWASMYAVRELNEQHPMWAEYFAYSEWFRLRICDHLKLPLDTKWGVIYKRVGIMMLEEYANREEYRRAYDFGNDNFLSDEVVPEMFQAFKDIKFQIVQRL